MNLACDEKNAWHLLGSRDPGSGEHYFPFRPYAADGSLRPCEEVMLSTRGVLFTWTTFAGQFYGQIDLPEDVRVQTVLDQGPHEIGASYHLDVQNSGDDLTWRFARD